MTDRAASFVFYDSFRTAIRRLPDDVRLQVWDEFIDVCLGYQRIEDVCLFCAVIADNCLPLIEAAKKRYAKAAKDGAKGGRPPTFVDRAKAEQIYKEVGSWNAVAEKLEVDIKTLQKARFLWYGENGKNGKNPYVDVDVEVDADADTYTSNISATASASALTAGGADVAKEKNVKYSIIKFPDGDRRAVTVPADKDSYIYFVKSEDGYFTKVYDSPHERAPMGAANNPNFYYDADQKVWVDIQNGEIIEAIPQDKCPSIYD